MHNLHPDRLSQSPNRAVVLAAGRGRRLMPFTNNRPKPLLRVDGKPILSYVVRALSQAGVRDVCLVVGYLGEQIAAYVVNGRRWDLRLSVRWQSVPRGTAHALRMASDFLTAPSFVLAADYALEPGYLLALKKAYIASGSSLAVSLKRLPEDQMAESSSVDFDDDGAIRRIVEKPEPDEAPSSIAASLIYIVPPTIRDYLQELNLSARGEYELVAVVNEMLADGYDICGLIQSSPREWSLPPARGCAT